MNTWVFITLILGSGVPFASAFFNLPGTIGGNQFDGGSTSDDADSSAADAPASSDSSMSNVPASFQTNDLTTANLFGSSNDVTRTSTTVELSSRIINLNDTVEELRQHVTSASVCQCAASAATSAASDDISSLTTQISTLSSTCSSQQSALNTLTGTINQASASLSDVDIPAMTSEVNQMINAFKESYQAMNNNIQTIEVPGVDKALLNDMLTQLNSISSDQAQLDSAVDSCTDQCSGAASSISGGVTKEEFSTLDESVRDIQTQVDSLPNMDLYATLDSVQSLEEHLAEISSLYAANTDHIDGLTSDLDDYKSQVESLVTVSEDTEKTVSNIESMYVSGTEFDELREKATTLESVLAAVNNDVGSIEQQSGSLTNTVQAVVGSADSVDADVQQVAGNLDTYNNEFKALKAQVNNAANSLETTKSDFDAECETLKSKVTALHGQVDGMSITASQLEGEVSSLKASYDSLQSSKNQMSGTISSSESSYTSHNNKASDLESAVSGLAGTASEVSDLKDYLEALRDDIKEYKTARDPICRKPFAMSYDNSVCYLINWNKLCWQEANTYCHSVGGPQAHLVNVDTNSKLYVITDILYWYSWESFWVGLFTLDEWSWPVTFSWIGGKTSFDTWWNYGEPNSYGEYQCGHLYNAGYGLGLDDTKCYIEKYSICEIPMDEWPRPLV